MFLLIFQMFIQKYSIRIWAIVEFFVDRWDWRRLCYSTNCWARSEYPATSRWQFSASKLTVHQWERGASAADATTESHAAESGVSPATSPWLFSEWRSGQSRSLMVWARIWSGPTSLGHGWYIRSSRRHHAAFIYITVLVSCI